MIKNNAASTSPSFTHNSLPRPPRHLASPETGRLLLASSYPRKKQGELFNPPASSSRLAPPPSPQAGLSPPRPLPADALPSPSPAGDEVIPEDAHLGAFPSILQFFRNERRGLIEDDRARKRKIAAEAEVRRALHRQTKAASTAPVSPLIINNKEGPILAVEQASLKHILPSGFAPLSSPSLLSYSSDDASISITSTRPTSIVSTSPRQSEKHVPTSLFSSPGTASMLSPASNFREDVQPVSPRRPSQLKRLAVQLDLSFPNDKFTIQRGLLSLEQEAAAVKAAGVGDAVVSSSPAQTQGSNVVHVFIDHSNILVGLISLPHTHLRSPHRGKRLLAHRPLTFLLERGRLAATRALVASSPLWQPLDNFPCGDGSVDWDVCVLKRVKLESEELQQQQRRRRWSRPLASSGSSDSSTEEDDALHTQQPLAFSPNWRHPSPAVSSSLFIGAGNAYHPNITSSVPRSSTISVAAAAPTVVAAARYKEQAVDELLQLKLLLTLLHSPAPATLVLATGDCAGSTLNPSGFRGCVELALARGWKVEVWGWKSGMGKGWRELERAWTGLMEVHELDSFREVLEVET